MTKLMSFFIFAGIALLLCQCQANDGSEEDQDTQQDTKKEKQVSNSKQLKEEGKTIVKSSGKALIGNLKKAIQQGGIQHAIKFCAVEAMPITDSLSKAHDVTLARVSHKNRNSRNEADSFEKQLIERYQTQIKEGKALKPSLAERDNKKVYYHPIKIKNGLCLNCHGKKGKTLSAETFELLRDEYPDGDAIGFELGDLRGLWKVQFKERNT